MQPKNVLEHEFGQAGATNTGLWWYKLKCRTTLQWAGYTVPAGTPIGESSGQKKKADARAFASQQARETLVSLLSPHESPHLEQPPPPPPQPQSQRLPKAVDPELHEMVERLAHVWERLGEENFSMQKKIARGLKELKESMGLDSSFLDELVRAAVEQHVPGKPPSAGRILKDKIDELIGAN